MTPPQDEAVAQALATAIKDGDRISDLLDELSRGRLWLPLPDDGGPVTDGSAVQLPTVVYLGSEFVPAFTSAELLARHGGAPPPAPAPALGTRSRRSVPHVVVPVAELARRLPPGLGIALNPGAAASVPIYPEGVTYIVSVTLDNPADVVFPGEHEPDDVDRWIADNAAPFHLHG